MEESYEEGSSEEIVVEFGQANKELVGSAVTPAAISGPFGLAEIFPSRGDRLLILDPVTHRLRIVTRLYRGIVVKTNKRKDPKAQESKNPEKNDEFQLNQKSSENLFDSSESSPEEVARKKRKRPEGGKEGQVGKTRIIRKIRTLSKQGSE